MNTKPTVYCKKKKDICQINDNYLKLAMTDLDITQARCLFERTLKCFATTTQCNLPGNGKLLSYFRPWLKFECTNILKMTLNLKILPEIYKHLPFV